MLNGVFSLLEIAIFSSLCAGGMFENCTRQAILELQLGGPNVSKSFWMDLRFKAAMLFFGYIFFLTYLHIHSEKCMVVIV